MALVHYLLVYDHSLDKLVREDPFSDADVAVDAYSALEEAHRDDRGMEIVLVSAESIEVIRKTHAHYFAESMEQLEMPLAVVA